MYKNIFTMDLDKINIYFVTNGPLNDNNKRDINAAISLLLKHIPEKHISKINADEGFPLIATGQLAKTDVFVFDKFEGDFFDQLQLTKSLIIGVRCLITCLTKNERIPLGSHPVFTCAMNNLKISASGIPFAEKEKLRVLIQWMGGHYFANFGGAVTHLISNTIKSKKYEIATVNGIPVMHVDWVQRVWSRSCVESINAVDEEFHKYRLPIFFNANITCSSLDDETKNKVIRLVNENGGIYHRAFQSQCIDIVITEKEKPKSQKYHAAVRFKKEILEPGWIFDSVEKGFALPTKAYQVNKLKVSTPTKNDQSIANFTASDHTQLSEISRISIASGNVNRNFNDCESICSNMTENRENGDFVMPPPRANSELSRPIRKRKNSINSYQLVFDKICPKQAKSAGPFLDGCCIYLSGFQPDEREKLNRILNVGGATRYDRINEKITHVIVGQLNDAEFRAWKKDLSLVSLNIVNLEWLLESISLKKLANELAYRVSLPAILEPDAPSPKSKRTLRSMNYSFKQCEKPVKKNLFTDGENVYNKSAFNEPEEENVLAQYSRENVPISIQAPRMPNALSDSCNTTGHKKLDVSAGNDTLKPVAPVSPMQPNTLSTITEGTTTINGETPEFFSGMALYIWQDHFAEEVYNVIVQECEHAQGQVVEATYKDMVDFVIVSCEYSFNPNVLPVRTLHVVTDLYLESCIKANESVPIEYYHQYIPHTANCKLLRDMTIVISLYTGIERDFIDALARVLGANVNKVFVKKERALLVCASPEGSKYEGAMRWHYPIVNSKWLVECAAQARKLPYNDYLVGDSVQEFPALENNISTIPDIPDVQNLKEAGELNKNIDVTPLRNKRITELSKAPPRKSCEFSCSAEAPVTPIHTAIPPLYDFEMMEKIVLEIEDHDQRECARQIMLEMRNNQTPEWERLRREASTPINRKLLTPKGIPDSCTTSALEKQVADELERLWRLPTHNVKPETPIEELRRRVIYATYKALGLADSDNDRSSTPTINENKSQARQADGRSGDSRNCNVTTHTVTSSTITTSTATSSTLIPSTTSISPRSSSQSRKAKRLTYTDDMRDSNYSNSLDGLSQSLNCVSPTSSGMMKKQSIFGKSTIDFDKISFEDTTIESRRNSKLTLATTTSPEFKQISEYLKNIGTREENKRKSASQESDELEIMDTEGHYMPPFESEQFGAGTEVMVDWRDPMEFDKERRLRNKTGMQYKGIPCFSISCNDMDERDDLISKILKLGGKMSENLLQYDDNCTHFVCERPGRAEKSLGCMAAGKWILSLKYIEESFAKDAFIDEELYEWGNCKALNLPQLTPPEQIIAQAGHRWRKTLASADKSKAGAFTGFCVILHTSAKTHDPFKKYYKSWQGCSLRYRTTV